MVHKIMKRGIIISLIMLFVNAALSAQSFTYTYEGVTFKGKIDHGQATIKSFDSKAPKVVVPSTVIHKGTSYPVDAIGVFMNGVNYSTVYLTLEEGITEIEKFCFNEFRKLREVKLPASLRKIGKNAFRDNSGMNFTMLSLISEHDLRQGNEVYVSDSQILTAEMRTTEAPDAVKQREKEQRDLEKSIERQKKEEARQLAEAEKQKKKDEKEALQRQIEEQEQKLKEQARLLAEATKQNQTQQNNDVAAADIADNDDSDDSLKGKLKGLFGSKKKKSSSKNNKKDNTQQKVAEPVAPAEPLIAQREVKPELPPVDVDVDIPVVKTDKNQNTYCVIIANENYEDVPVVDFASRDGEVFREYCIKTLGVPEKQIKTFINASYTDIKRALNWVETMTEISEGNSKVIFYYAGHGIPNEKDKAAYLIPTDGFPKDITTCFKLADIYSRLGKMHTKNITVLLDACFSGVKRGSGQALIAARGVALKPREEVLPPNMIVFTAASNDETALSYGEKRHGMFTYFLLDRLKKSKGETSFGDLFIHLSQNVKKNSMLENDKLQTPNVAYPNALGRKWESMTF